MAFTASRQYRSPKNQTGHRRCPASVLAPETALGLLASIALSSAQANSILNCYVNRRLIYMPANE
jgi:hypothetical protein